MVKKAKKNNYSKLLEKYWLGIAALIFIVLFVVLYFFFARLSIIEYNGLTFIKEKYSDLTVYRYSYYFNNNGQTFKNNIYLRIDPRKNEVPVYGEIEYIGKIAYLGINSTGLTQCSDSQIALAGLVQFLTNNQLTTRIGTTSQTESIEKNQTFVDCDATPGSTVINIGSADKTEIIRTQKRCYEIKVESCDDVIYATEKFVVQSLIDAKASAELPNN